MGLHSSEGGSLTVILAGGSGGLGSQRLTLLSNERFDLVISYKSNRERAATIDRHLLRVVAGRPGESTHDRCALLDVAPELYGVGRVQRESRSALPIFKSG